MNRDNYRPICGTCGTTNHAGDQYCIRCHNLLGEALLPLKYTETGLSPSSLPQTIPLPETIKSINPSLDEMQLEPEEISPISDVSLPEEFFQKRSADREQAAAPTLSPGLLRSPIPRNIFNLSRFSKRRWYQVIIGISLLLVLFGTIIILMAVPKEPRQQRNLPSSVNVPVGMDVFKAPDGEIIGISDGGFPFDTDVSRGRDAQAIRYKQQASAQLKAGNTSAAEALWLSALALDSSDAESSIYLENQRVLDSGMPYVEFVIGESLNGDAIYTNREILQGVYVAQHEYNVAHASLGDMQIRILIANCGGVDPTYAKLNALQIASLVKTDKHIIGVMGWSSSNRTLDALPILASQHIVVLSQNATDDSLTGISPYFFRIVPPNHFQGSEGAKYAYEAFHASNIALFVDPAEPYSQSLANDFEQQFTVEGGHIVAKEMYKLGQPANFPTLLHDALLHKPDLIYFAGNSPDIADFIKNLPSSGPFAAIRVMTGDAGYGLASFNSQQQVNYNRLLFTAQAFPDEWVLAGLNPTPPFVQEYMNDFSRGKVGYGYTRSGAYTIVSYDAMTTLFTGIKIVMQHGQTSLTSDSLDAALPQITGSQSIQGMSGQIAFDQDRDPVNKAIVILQVNSDGTTHLVAIRGCYLKGHC